MAFSIRAALPWVNVVCALLLLIVGILTLIFGGIYFTILVVGIYEITFAVLALGVTFNFATSMTTHPAVSFLRDLRGQGIFYLFWGILSIGGNLIIGILLILGAIGLIAASFTPALKGAGADTVRVPVTSRSAPPAPPAKNDAAPAHAGQQPQTHPEPSAPPAAAAGDHNV
ncbi:hypothetical protein H9P43_002465 [Blastocladiella emersonii ATCC 22665]|nr:hypothetical protein H9P43_002465 [Blastocladiella emersonii ATCC 22665]